MRALALLLVLFQAQAPSSESLRLPCAADTMLSMSHGEEKLNHGTREALRVKGIEEVTLLDFDVTPLKGRVVEEARLYFFPVAPHKLKMMGLSTIGTPWKEGRGHGQPAQAGEACFTEAAHGERPWAHPGSDFLAVSMSHGGSIWFMRELRAEPDGWASVDLPPAILHAMVEGNSFGLCLSDERSQTGFNNHIYSREQNAKAPYVVVSKSKLGAAPPSGAKKYVAPPEKKPADRAAEFLKKIDAPAAVEPAALADAVRYRILHEGETNLDAKPAGRLWDGRSIHLEAARGEHVAFEIAIEIPSGSRAIRFEGTGWTASRVLPVGSTYDPLIPVEGEVTGKALFHIERYVAKSEAAGEQKLTLALKTGQAGVPIPVTLRVHSAVIPDALAFQTSLNAYHTPGEVLGDKPGSPAFLEMERSFHRLAHEHRGTLAIVPYSHRGRLQEGVAPETRRSGAKVEVTSWKAYDERFGPYFDGSAFKGLPRDGVPMGHFYWPMHENWPLPINEYYSYHGKAEDHWRDAPAPDEAFAEEYGRAFRDIVHEFGAHAAEKRWSQTQFQVFLNNKPDVRFQRHENEGAWWRLDEPVSAEDHLALRYFGRRAQEAIKTLKGVNVKFRADLSRPQWRRDFLDGVLGLDCCAGSYRQYPERVFSRGDEVWIYGGVSIGGSGEEARAWTIQVFLDGADGNVPWLALGTAKAWEKPEDTALILPPRAGGDRRPCPTLRLKGLRRGELDVELFHLLLAKMKASRDEIRPGVAGALGLLGTFRKTSEVDAGRVDYGRLDPDRFEAVRRAVLEALDK